MRIFLKREFRCKLSVVLVILLFLGTMHSNGFLIVQADTSVQGTVSGNVADVTPGDGSVTPGDGSVTPGDGSVTPGDGTVTPGDGTVTSGDGSLLEDNGFVFEQYDKDSSTANYSEGSFVNTAMGGSGAGEITYTSSDETTATVNGMGEVSFVKSGSVRITATRASDGIYQEVSTYYTLHISKAAQEPITFMDDSPVIKQYAAGQTYTNILFSSGSGTGKLAYTVTDENGGTDNLAAFIDETSGQLTFSHAGTVVVTARREGDDCYLENSGSYTLTIEKGKLDAFGFATEAPEPQIYSEGGYYDNAISGDFAEGTVTYSIIDAVNIRGEADTIARIDASTGRVTFLKAGTVRVQAYRPADDNYQEASAEYMLQIQRGEQSPLVFTRQNSNSIQYGTHNNIYQNQANSDGRVIGENDIVYTITDENGGTTEIASIEEATGKVSVFRKGIVIITASRAEDDKYRAVSASYNLVITEGRQEAFYFPGKESVEVQLKDGYYYRQAAGGSGDSAIEYSISFSSAEGVADIINTDDAEQPRGTVLFHKPGYIRVTAQKAGGNCYNTVEATYELTIMGEQDVVFDNTKQPGTNEILENDCTIYYGQSLHIIATAKSQSESPADGVGHGNGAFTYEVIDGKEIAVLENSDSGILTFRNQKIGCICVRARTAADYDAYYNAAWADYAVNVEYLPAPQEAYTISGNQYNGWYTGDVRIHAPEGYLISYSNDLTDNDWEEYVLLADEEVGAVTGKVVYLKKKSSGEVTDGGITDGIAVETIYRDVSAPEELSVSYQQSLVDTVLQTLSFGLYQGSVEVTLSAVDWESGLESFTYSYKVSAGVNAVNQGLENVKVELAEGQTSYRFTIPAQFRGKVSFTAMNHAGMGMSLEDQKTIIVDDINPVCKVEYMGNYVAMTDAKGEQTSVSDGDTRYIYDSEVSATIKITEANFDINELSGKQVEVIVYKDGESVTEGTGYSFLEEEWTYIEDGDYYVRSIVFGKDTEGNLVDGDYVMEIHYTDAMGNEMEGYRSNVHCVNTEELDILMTYDDDNAAWQESYYNKSRTATITVKGRNIRLNDINIQVTAENKRGEVSFDLASRMSDWTVVEMIAGYPSAIQATITYDMDATYTFDMLVKDLAGHEASVSDSFTYDHTAPSASDFVIRYSEPINQYSGFWDKLLSVVMFRYYNKAGVTIEVQAEDVTSGIDKLYLYYAKQDGSSNVNVSALQKVPLGQLAYNEDGSIASASYTLPTAAGEQYCGSIGLLAVDRAGNESDIYMDNGSVVVVDSIAPTRWVEYSPAKQVVNRNTKETTVDYKWNAENTNSILYYDDKMTMTYTVDEANFHPEDVVFWVNGERTSSLNWKQKGDIWTGVLTLSADGDYIVSMEYQDKSDNAMQLFTSEQITIDTQDPVVSVSYSPSGSRASYDGRAYYDTSVTATITVKERNFRAADVEAVITAQDVTGAGVAVPDYVSYLKTESSWTSRDDVHTAVVTFQTDANYSFAIGYKDLALRNATDYQPYLFAVDQINPGNLSLNYSQSVFDIIMQSVTFGYYNAPVSVTMTAEDNTSGISRFEYSYLTAQGVSPVNASQEGITIATGEISYSDNKRTATAVFRVPGNELRGDNQFNGTVKFIAYDRAGRNTSFDDSRRVIVDNIAPSATITFNDPVRVVNDTAYYAGSVDGVVRITEANFVEEDVTVTVVRDGANSQQMQVSWSDENVDVHVGRFQLSEDGNYVVRVEYKDRSGNEMTTYQSGQLTIDTQKPTITITGVANRYAGRDDRIGFVVTVEDDNMDAASFQPLLMAETVDAEGNFLQTDVSSLGKVSAVTAGKRYTYTVNNLDADGIYSLTCKVNDMAGNESANMYVDASGQEMEQLQFSVNRNGSTYSISDSTKYLLGKYTKSPMDIVITEINATKLSNIKITLYKNDKTVVLEEGKDYRIDIAGGNGEWYSYTYTIFKENFQDDGVYRISIYSEDEAGNVAENTLDVKGLEITFAVDKTSPNLIITNLESNTTYPYENYMVIMQAGDNLRLESIEVVLDGGVYRTWNAEEIAEMEEQNAEYTFAVSGVSARAHNLEVRLSDAASNEVVEMVSDFYITTNKWVQFYHNKLLFYGSIAGVIAVICGVTGIVVLLSRKRKEP